MAPNALLQKSSRNLIAVLIAAWLALAWPGMAWAHPLGNFTINHFAGLRITPNAVTVDFVLDMAEIAAFQEISTFDADGNGRPDPAETAGYHGSKCRSLSGGLELHGDGRLAGLTLVASDVTFPAGAGGLPTLRLSCLFSARLDPAVREISFVDNTYAERIGWREIVVTPDGVTLANVPPAQTSSLSGRLTAYPKDLLTSPLNQRDITFRIGAGAASQAAGTAAPLPGAAPVADRNDTFTRLILLDNLTPSAVLAALAIALLWGAMHALTPGHGKTIVGAYLVGSRGTAAHAAYLGLTTTITHTLGVFVFGLVTFFAAKFIVPEQLYPWMSVLSGLFVIGIGANLLMSRFRSSGLGSTLRRFVRSLSGRSPAKFVIRPAAQPGPLGAGAPHASYALSAAGASTHTHGQRTGHLHIHFASGPHDHDHDHGRPGSHTHLPPGTDGGVVTWRSLLLLGISGGILPCPSALVVLLGAIALDRIGFGLALVLAFSLGLAGALTVIGLMFIYAGRLFGRVPMQTPIVRFIPIFSALFIALIGVAITARALAQIGIASF